MGANKVMDNTAKRSTDDVRSIIDDVQLPGQRQFASWAKRRVRTDRCGDADASPTLGG